MADNTNDGVLQPDTGAPVDLLDIGGGGATASSSTATHPSSTSALQEDPADNHHTDDTLADALVGTSSSSMNSNQSSSAAKNGHNHNDGAVNGDVSLSSQQPVAGDDDAVAEERTTSPPPLGPSVDLPGGEEQEARRAEAQPDGTNGIQTAPQQHNSPSSSAPTTVIPISTPSADENRDVSLSSQQPVAGDDDAVAEERTTSPPPQGPSVDLPGGEEQEARRAEAQPDGTNGIQTAPQQHNSPSSSAPTSVIPISTPSADENRDVSLSSQQPVAGDDDAVAEERTTSPPPQGPSVDLPGGEEQEARRAEAQPDGTNGIQTAPQQHNSSSSSAPTSVIPISTPSADENALNSSSNKVAAKETTAVAATATDAMIAKDNDQTNTDRQRIESLEQKLAESLALIESLQQQAIGDERKNNNEKNDDDDSLLTALQSNLQHQMSLKAEAENKARLAEHKIKELEATNEAFAQEIQQFQDLQDILQQQMSAKAEAENKARLALERVQKLESARDKLKLELGKFTELESKLQEQMSAKGEAELNARNALERVEILQQQEKEQSDIIVKLQKQICDMREEMSSQHKELLKIREERDEQHRKEMALTSRLNAAKMKESVKGNLAEQYEDDINAIEQELQDTKEMLAETAAEKQRLGQELEQVIKTSNDRVALAERSLSEERRLNEERKRKMKSFVENKAEELRQTKADNEALQIEVTQTTGSFTELNNRWKQLHAQYVQSQTRNRELQRDMNRMKKDSENLHKVGDSLEMKLSRSATATEEHKNKRIAAKHELMTVLRTLEAEREITARLRDTIKFTFTPKALSQQRLLRESLDEFEAQLQKLSVRLGRPLPPSTVESPFRDAAESTEHSCEENVSAEGKASRSDSDISRLISKLETETQAVSQCIMALTGSVERMHLVLDASGDRNCYSVLGEILRTGGAASSPAAHAASSMDDSESGTRRTRLSSVTARHRYGTVPAAALH